MERNFRKSEFERFVQENADQYRMFPSEKVWNNLHKSLHKKRRWQGLGLAFLLLLTGTAVTFVMRSYPVVKGNLMVVDNTSGLQQFEDPKEVMPAPTDLRDITPFNETTKNIQAHIRQQLTPQPDGINQLQVAAKTEPFIKDTKESRRDLMASINASLPELRHSAIVVNMDEYWRNTEAIELPGIPVSNEEIISETDLAQNMATLPEPPFTIESVVNSYKPAPKRISWQIFLTPTVSYRALSSNKDFSGDNNNGSPFPFEHLDDVNKAVTHKPDLGFQVGINGRYPITKSINLRAGLHLNINKYDIKAFYYPEVAVINLDDPNQAPVSTWTRYRSRDGYASNWLKNSYISVSVPIGAEVKLLGNEKTNVGFAATLAPTYVVRDKAYLISTDLKNYAQVPWLIRKVNMSTGFEAFVNYGKGKTRWQVGPQVRYQLLSSFQNKYPVKENLFDFGLKVGLTLNP